MSTPLSQAGYAVNLGSQPYGAPTFAQAVVSMWFDSTDSAVPGGTPRPASTEFPLPVQIVGGTAGGGGGGNVTQGTSPWIDNIAQFGGTPVNIGQQARATSLPVTLASDQPPVTVSDPAAASLQASNAGSGIKVSDTQSAAFQGVVAMTAGTSYTPQRSVGFVCTAAGPITLILADGSTITLGITASPAFQSLPFAVASYTLGAGTAGTFWNLK